MKKFYIPPLLNTPLLVTHQKGYLYELALIETKM